MESSLNAWPKAFSRAALFQVSAEVRWDEETSA